MKTPKEWFEEELSGEPLTQESVIEVLEMVQKDAWNAAINKAVENVELTIEGSDYHSMTYQDLGSDDLVMVDIDSLLKLKL